MGYGVLRTPAHSENILIQKKNNRLFPPQLIYFSTWGVKSYWKASSLIEDILWLENIFGLTKIDKKPLSLRVYFLVTLLPSNSSGLERYVLRESASH